MLSARAILEIALGAIVALVGVTVIYIFSPLVLRQEHLAAVSCSAAQATKNSRMEFRCHAAAQDVPKPMRRYEVSSDGTLYEDIGNGIFRRMAELPVKRGRATSGDTFACIIAWSTYPSIPFSLKIPGNPPGIMGCREAIQA